MKRGTKGRTIVARFDDNAYEKISNYATIEHRGLGEFVRHATLFYIERLDREQESASEKGGEQP